MFFGSPDEPTSSTIGWKCVKIAFSVIVLYISAFLNISIFLIRERFNNKKVPISGPYVSSSEIYANFHFGRKSGSLGMYKICFNYVVFCSENNKTPLKSLGAQGITVKGSQNILRPPLAVWRI